MMRARVFGDSSQLFGERQLREHLIGQGRVVVDDLPFLVIQRPAPDAQVVHFVFRKQRPELPVAHPLSSGDLPNAFDHLILREFASDVHLQQKTSLFVQLLQFPFRLPCFGTGRVFPSVARCEQTVPFQHLEPRCDFTDAVVHLLQLGGLVHDMVRRGDFSDIVQPGRHPQLPHFILGQAGVCVMPVAAVVDGFGNLHGQAGHAPDMAAGVRRFFIDGQRDGLNESFQQGLQFKNQQVIGERHRRLRGQRPGQIPGPFGKRDHTARFLIARVDHLQNADDFILVIEHRNDQHGFRAVARLLVERPGTVKIESGRVVNILDVHRLPGNRHMGGNVCMIGQPVGAGHGHGRPGNFLACSPHRHTHGFILDEGELKLSLVFRHQIQCASVRGGNGAGFR